MLGVRLAGIPAVTDRDNLQASLHLSSAGELIPEFRAASADVRISGSGGP